MAGPSGVHQEHEISASDSSSSDEQQRKRRKVAEPSEWKKNVARTKRNKGEEYVSERTGKTMRARKIGAPCTCKEKCFEKVTMPVIEKLFKDFWALGNFDKQNYYLSKVIHSLVVKRRRKPARGGVLHRRHTVQYTVLRDKTEIVVCRKAFLSIFDVSDTRIRTVLEKESSTGTVQADRRGTTTHARAIAKSDIDVIKEHINTIPTVTSHYCRAKSRFKKYMAPELNRARLHALYLDFIHEKYPEKTPVKDWKYNQVFDKEFNIGFAPTKSDTCNTCTVLEGQINHYETNPTPAPSVTLEDLKQTLSQHKDLARKGQHLLTSFYDKHSGDEDTLGCCFDLQQTLPTPKLSTNVAYYKRKLWTYNLGIYNMKTRIGTMYVWDEVTARRGSVEIASCLTHWVENNHSDEVNLILFLDNCAGQNKNINMVLSLMRLIHQRKFFNITHNFLVPGHSMMPCDRQFGNIEKKLRLHDTIPTKHDYVRIIQSATKKGFKVVEVMQEMIRDIDVLQTKITKRKSNQLNFSDARRIVLDVSYSEGFKIQEDYEEDGSMHLVRLMPGKKKYDRKTFDLSLIDLPRKYDTPIRLAPEKVRDLKDLLIYIHPQEKANYFRDIIDKQERVPLSDPDSDSDDEGEVQDNVLDYA